GWASADITPDQPVLILGQFHARVSEGVADPLSATAMALESTGPDGEPVRSVIVSCDVAAISDDLCNAVRQRVPDVAAELDPMHVVMNATHTHTGPQVRVTQVEGCVPNACGLTPEELGIMPPEDYVAFAADRIADAIARAWNNREPAGIGFGLGHATVGYNRRICYYTGETIMYGGVHHPEFSHLEGTTDTSVNILCTWNRDEQLTGVVVNIACPSQVSEQDFQISADYWHETRLALRQRLGEDVFILPQCSAAGDVVPAKSRRTVPDWKALERMWERQGRTHRQDIAESIADAVTPVVEGVGREIDWQPTVTHRVETVPLTRRLIDKKDVDEALAEADQWEEKYEALRQELDANPQKRNEPRWYVDISKASRRIGWHRGVAERYELQQREPKIETEVHVLRLGEVAFATNRFEYYLDFGLQIKARSPATQTFVVQLAGPGTYLPTQRAASGKSYGAVPASTLVGPEGGRELADWTVAALEQMWQAQPVAT
ncbi:MAG: hypothetical protein ACODAQ_10100, partial [Phycisphaeraceae bacterium]